MSLSSGETAYAIGVALLLIFVPVYTALTWVIFDYWRRLSKSLILTIGFVVMALTAIADAVLGVFYLTIAKGDPSALIGFFSIYGLCLAGLSLLWLDSKRRYLKAQMLMTFNRP
jgi:hypothetical protein